MVQKALTVIPNFGLTKMYLKELNIAMINNPTVSIIIPCYNRELFICDAIDSALNQTYSNIEIVVVNDGSTDNTHEIIISKYIDKIKYIQQKNSGASFARNLAIKSSIGEWILTLDSDDYISPNYVSDAIEKIKDKKTLVTARAFIVDDKLNGNSYYPDISIFNKTINLESMINQNQVITSSLFSKELWEKAGGYNEKIKRAEDWEFWVNLVSCGANVTYINKNEPYLKYRIHGDNKSTKNQHLLEKTARYIKQKYKDKIIK
jgi:glycosyltransferase involved in cell wall biosynthesis